MRFSAVAETISFTYAYILEIEEMADAVFGMY